MFPGIFTFLLVLTGINCTHSSEYILTPSIRTEHFKNNLTDGRFIGKPISYGANTSCTYNAFRIILSNDVETNPGPCTPTTNCTSNPCTKCDRHINSIKGIRIAILNIDSILGKLDDLRLFLGNNKLDIVCINETKLGNQICSEEVHIDGFSVTRHDRNRHGGGVAIYVNNELDSTFRKDLEIESVESTFVEISIKGSKSLLIGTLYRPPSKPADFIETIKDHITNVIDTCSNCNIVITGDFNSDLLNKDKKKKIDQLCKEVQLNSLIYTPTRVTQTSKTCLDLILVSDKDKVFATGNIPVGFSDHNLVFMSYKTYHVKVKPKIVKTRTYRKFNASAYENDLNNCNWNLVFQETDPNAAWCTFKDIVKEICDKHAPIVEVRVKGNQPAWFNDEILSLCKDRDVYKAKAQKSNSPADWKTYRDIRNQTNNTIKQVKKNYYSDTIKENRNDGKKLWKVLKSILPSKAHQTVKEIAEDDQVISEPKKIADCFNTYFINVGQNLAEAFNGNTSDTLEPPKYSGGTLSFSCIEEEFVRNQLLKLSVGKATGIDGLNSRLLRAGAHQIARPLTFIMNLTITTGIIPPEWKTAIVTPIFKAGSKKECSNYRPISVLPVVSKILERAIHDQLYHHLSENNLLTSTQSGFRPKHSTLTAAIDVTDYILSNMDNGDLTGAVFLDLKKAFDTVDHTILLSKLSHLGVIGKELNWFANYLKNRQQCTVIDSMYSGYGQVKVGVPQGSILGPLLFVCFINDLPNVIPDKSKVVLYADDTGIMCKSKSIAHLNNVLNKVVDNVDSWMSTNKLTVNASKTKVMLFGSQRKIGNSTLDIKLGNVNLEQVSVFKYLGLWFDPYLRWDSHTEKIASKLSQKIGILRRIRQFIDQPTMCLLYNAIVLPHIDYCCPIWSSSAGKYTDKIQILQNHAARLTLGCKIREKHVIDIYKELKWMNVEQRSNYFTLVIFYRCLHGLAPEYLSDNVRIYSHNHGTRSQSSTNMCVERSRTDWGERAFKNAGARLWNILPIHIKNSPSVDSFKSQLKNHILGKGKTK